jgi:signal transduction histidine kinase
MKWTVGSPIWMQLGDGALVLVLAAIAVAGWVVVPFAIGRAVRVGRVAAARSRAQAVQRHTYEERLRIAREVHDVVGHGLAAINMQAEIALHVLSKRPEQAETALVAISKTSKQALDELRLTLAVLRRDNTGRRSRPPSASAASVILSNGCPASGCRSR